MLQKPLYNKDIILLINNFDINTYNINNININLINNFIKKYSVIESEDLIKPIFSLTNKYNNFNFNKFNKKNNYEKKY